MSDTKQTKRAKKRQSKNSKQNSATTKDKGGTDFKMATPSASSGSSNVNVSSSLPASFPVSNFLNIPPPFPTYQSSQPQPNDLSSQMNFIISKVSKLDSMESQQETILSRLSSIEAAVAENKRMIENTSKKLIDIESSQKFLSEEYDKLSKSADVNTRDLSKVQVEVKALAKENKELKTNNQSLAEDIIDLKCRSMRDNMIFLGIPETSTPLERGAVGGADSGTEHMDVNQPNDAQSSPRRTYAQVTASEDCAHKIYDFCDNVLKIPRSRECIQIDRAHRVGAPSAGKTRPIVVKFKDTDSKMRVKNSLKHIDLKQSPYAVFDQLPKEVQERRKSLIPTMLDARRRGKTAVLIRDKIYINNRLYKPNSVSGDADASADT
ncbi:MAG: hypothetical protein AB2693_35000 [Candidatus Thiodiazotropha sp.]